jgi:transposase
MAALRGWAERGRRLTVKVPHGRWKTMTFLAALRHDRIDAPWFLEGPINGESFRLYVEKVLLPTLRPGDIVVMDNLGSHKGQAVRQLIRSAGAKLFFLPKYSPDLNPIEQVFAKLKIRLSGLRRGDHASARAGSTDRGRHSTETTVAQILVSKYADHLPLYRQAQIYSRQAVALASLNAC